MVVCCHMNKNTMIDHAMLRKINYKQEVCHFECEVIIYCGYL